MLQDDDRSEDLHLKTSPFGSWAGKLALIGAISSSAGIAKASASRGTDTLPRFLAQLLFPCNRRQAGSSRAV